MQTGATVVAYDGSPLKPMGVLWDLVEKLKSVHSTIDRVVAGVAGTLRLYRQVDYARHFPSIPSHPPTS